MSRRLAIATILMAAAAASAATMMHTCGGDRKPFSDVVVMIPYVAKDAEVRLASLKILNF